MPHSSLATIAKIIAAMIALGSAPLHARDLLAARNGWAAFREQPAMGCRAVTRAATWSRGASAAPHMAVLVLPGRARNQLHFSLSRPATAATLVIGARSFPLIVREGDAWTGSAADDDAVLALMRLGGVLRVEGQAKGRRFADIYRLEGAPTAIDAARLGCLR